MAEGSRGERRTLAWAWRSSTTPHRWEFLQRVIRVIQKRTAPEVVLFKFRLAYGRRGSRLLVAGRGPRLVVSLSGRGGRWAGRE